MDAKSKANFINSVAGAQKIPCPNCNTLNDADSMFCAICGTRIGTEQEEQITSNAAPFSAPAFAPANTQKSKPVSEDRTNEKKPQTDAAKPAFQIATPESEDVPEEVSVFAEGLPDWDMVPPQVVVRRKNK